MASTRVATKPRPPQQRGIRTRQQILDAAVECLVELGYAGTTTMAIQARAGVSRGSLLHHFPSRDELLVGAVAHLAEARFAVLEEQANAGATRKNRIDAAVEAMWDSFQGPLFVAITELWLAARTHDELRAVLFPAELETGRAFGAGLQKIFGPPYCDHPRFAEVLDLLGNAMRGAALLHNLDQSPRRDAALVRSWKRIAHDILDQPLRD